MDKQTGSVSQSPSELVTLAEPIPTVPAAAEVPETMPATKRKASETPDKIDHHDTHHDKNQRTIPADILGGEIARLCTNRGTFTGLMALGEDVAKVIKTVPGLVAPWEGVLAKPLLMFRGEKKANLVPTLFSTDKMHLVGEIRDPYDPEVYFGVVIWSLQRECSYVMHSVATAMEGANSAQWDERVRLIAYAMPLDGRELVISDTCGGLQRMFLIGDNDDAIYGTMEDIKAGNPWASEWGNADCLVFTKDGEKLITGNINGLIEIRDRHVAYILLSQFQMEAHPYLSCIAVGRNDSELALDKYLGTIELWDIERGRKTNEIRVGTTQWVVKSNLHYSPNSEYLMAVTRQSNRDPNRDKRYALWHHHFETGKECFSMVGYEKAVEVPVICRAGFSDNLTSWSVSLNHLCDWNAADGTPVGEPHNYTTMEDFAISDD